ncbi:MAG: SGNH/GDSL hydrolase family protein [Burkholderiales bacterium]|nr:SGNH/GDSL hydrolase family protein [Burkholderiales bacterium]
MRRPIPQTFHRRWAAVRTGLAAVLLAGASCLAQAAPFSSVYVFGDSLSDAGNNAVALGGSTTPLPIAGNSFVPAYPYASGHYTDGAVWAQTFAAYFGTSAAPSLLGGTDYAYGGARTGPSGAGFPPSLLDQVTQFLTPLGPGGKVPTDALFVIAGGGNNARDALAAVAGGADPTATLLAAAAGFVTDTLTMVSQLASAGAADIVVWTAPNIALAPAVRALGNPAASAFATALAGAMNQSLAAALAPFGDVRIFDLAGLLEDAVADPSAFGLANVTDACAALVSCDPSAYLFWDGIHPTSAGQALIARGMIALVPAPGSLALMLAALGPVLLLTSRRRAA